MTSQHLTDMDITLAAFEPDKVSAAQREHLATCGSCRKTLEDYREIKSSYQSTASREVPSDFVLGNIRSRAAAAAREAHKGPSPWLFWWKKPAWATSLLILILAVFLYEKRDILEEHPMPPPVSSATSPASPAPEYALKTSPPQKAPAPVMPSPKGIAPKTMDHDDKDLPGAAIGKSEAESAKKMSSDEEGSLDRLHRLEKSGQCRQAIAEAGKIYSSLSKPEQFQADKIRILCHIKLGEKSIARRLLDEMKQASPADASVKQLEELAR